MSTSPFKYHTSGMPFMVSDILNPTEADSYYKKSMHNSYSSCTPSPSVHSPTYSHDPAMAAIAYQLTPPSSSNISPTDLSTYYSQHYYYNAGHDNFYASSDHLYQSKTQHNNSSTNAWYDPTQLASNKLSQFYFKFLTLVPQKIF